MHGVERSGEMRRLSVALTACVALCAPLLPAVARASGRPVIQRPFQTVGAAPMRGGFLSQPIFRPPGAFGSPGGFPLPLPGSEERRLAPVPPARLSHRVPSHLVPRFPVTTVFYAPPAFYQPPVETSPQAISVAPIVYVSPTVYVSLPAMSPPPVAVVMASPTAPMPAVVEHPTGRYELRGDGVGTPYVWVWIPNPPSAPPAASAPAPEESRAGSASAVSRSQIYRWTDDEGTVIWTNRMESIPESQRPRAQKLGQAAVQP